LGWIAEQPPRITAITARIASGRQVIVIPLPSIVARTPDGRASTSHSVVGPPESAIGYRLSVYDGVTMAAASSFDIDHVVALKEAWDSGAWSWTSARRQGYANDLGDSRSLCAVSAASNRAKSEKDPAQWLPPPTSFRCTYATEWVVVKVRWRLSVDTLERAALTRNLPACPARTVAVAVRPAATSSTPPSPTPIARRTPAPTPTAAPTLAPGGACDPN